MEYITERSEITQALNFGKMPVVYVADLAACRTDYGWNLGKVKIAGGFAFIVAELYIFRDKKELVTCTYDACIKSEFGWNDVAEMATNANLPVIAPNSKFVLVAGKKETGERRARKGIIMVIDTGKAQFNTDEPISIGEDMCRMLVAMGEDM